jgi:hypothetical protein
VNNFRLREPRSDTEGGKGYLLIACAVGVLLTVQTLGQHWSSDFWEHAAAVRELARRPFAPQHPLLPVDLPHHSFSLYTWVLALLVRFVGVAPITALQLAALLNLVLLLVAFPRFVGAMTGSRRAAPFALVIVLLAWGPAAWRYSGFLNINSIGFVLPFPSMFAVALTLLAVGTFDQWAFRPRHSWLVVTLVGFLVLNAHAPTGGALGIVLVAVALHRRLTQNRWRH